MLVREVPEVRGRHRPHSRSSRHHSQVDRRGVADPQGKRQTIWVCLASRLNRFAQRPAEEVVPGIWLDGHELFPVRRIQKGLKVVSINLKPAAGDTQRSFL